MSQGIEFNRLMLEMRSLQADAMARAKPVATTPEPGAPSFSELLGQAVGKEGLRLGGQQRCFLVAR